MKHPAPIVGGIVAGLIIPVFFLAIVHKSLFRRNVQGWFPRWSSWYEGILIIVGSILSFLVMTPFVFAACSQSYRCRYISDSHMGVILTTGLVFGAFFFQVEYLIRQAVGRKRVKPVPTETSSPLAGSSQATPQSAPIDPVHSELERLKRELGN